MAAPTRAARAPIAPATGAFLKAGPGVEEGAPPEAPASAIMVLLEAGAEGVPETVNIQG